MSDPTAPTPPSEAEIEQLRAQVAELESKVDASEATAQQKGPWWRTTVAVVLLVVGALLLPIGTVGIWARNTIADTDQYVATVAPLIRDKQVQQLIGDKLTDQLFATVDLPALAGEVVPPKAQPLVGPITSGIQSWVRGQVQQILASPQAASAWDQINRQLQEKLIAALKGDNSGAIQVQGDSVVLDTGALFEQVKQLLVDRGFTIFAKVPIPKAADQQIVLFKSEQIRQVSTIYRVTEPIANALIWVALLFFVAAVAVANNRRRMLFAAGLVFALMSLLLGVSLSAGRTVVLSALGASDASVQATTLNTLLRYLFGLIRSGVALGLGVALAAWLAGPSGPAVAIRSAVMGVLAPAAAKAAAASPRFAAVGTFFARSRVVWQIVIVVLAIVSIFASRPVSGGRIVWSFVLAALSWLVVEFMAAAGGGGAQAEQPAAEVTAASG